MAFTYRRYVHQFTAEDGRKYRISFHSNVLGSTDVALVGARRDPLVLRWRPLTSIKSSSGDRGARLGNPPWGVDELQMEFRAKATNATLEAFADELDGSQIGDWGWVLEDITGAAFTLAEGVLNPDADVRTIEYGGEIVFTGTDGLADLLQGEAWYVGNSAPGSSEAIDAILCALLDRLDGSLEGTPGLVALFEWATEGAGQTGYLFDDYRAFESEAQDGWLKIAAGKTDSERELLAWEALGFLLQRFQLRLRMWAGDWYAIQLVEANSGNPTVYPVTIATATEGAASTLLASLPYSPGSFPTWNDTTLRNVREKPIRRKLPGVKRVSTEHNHGPVAQDRFAFSDVGSIVASPAVGWTPYNSVRTIVDDTIESTVAYLEGIGPDVNGTPDTVRISFSATYDPYLGQIPPVITGFSVRYRIRWVGPTTKYWTGSAWTGVDTIIERAVAQVGRKEEISEQLTSPEVGVGRYEIRIYKGYDYGVAELGETPSSSRMQVEDFRIQYQQDGEEGSPETTYWNSETPDAQPVSLRFEFGTGDGGGDSIRSTWFRTQKSDSRLLWIRRGDTGGLHLDQFWIERLLAQYRVPNRVYELRLGWEDPQYMPQPVAPIEIDGARYFMEEGDWYVRSSEMRGTWRELRDDDPSATHLNTDVTDATFAPPGYVGVYVDPRTGIAIKLVTKPSLDTSIVQGFTFTASKVGVDLRAEWFVVEDGVTDEVTEAGQSAASADSLTHDLTINRPTGIYGTRAPTKTLYVRAWDETNDEYTAYLAAIVERNPAAEILSATLQISADGRSVTVDNIVGDADSASWDIFLYADDDTTNAVDSYTGGGTPTIRIFSNVDHYGASTWQVKITPKDSGGNPGVDHWIVGRATEKQSAGIPASNRAAGMLGFWRFLGRDMTTQANGDVVVEDKLGDGDITIPASATRIQSGTGLRITALGGGTVDIPTSILGVNWDVGPFTWICVVKALDITTPTNPAYIQYTANDYLAMQLDDFNTGTETAYRALRVTGGSGGSETIPTAQGNNVWHVFAVWADPTTGDFGVAGPPPNSTGYDILTSREAVGSSWPTGGSSYARLFQQSPTAFELHSFALFDKIMTDFELFVAIESMANAAREQTNGGIVIPVRMSVSQALPAIDGIGVRLGGCTTNIVASSSYSSVNVDPTDAFIRGVGKLAPVIILDRTTYNWWKVYPRFFYAEDHSGFFAIGDENGNQPITAPYTIDADSDIYLWTDNSEQVVESRRREILNADDIATNVSDISALDTRLTAAEDEVGQWTSSDPGWAATSATAISWNAFTFYPASGGSVSMLAGSASGLTSAPTYLYYNGTTTVQVSTNPADSQGTGKILLAVAWSGSVSAHVVPRVGFVLIDRDQLAADIIDSARIVDGAVAEAKIATSAITETKISSDAITTPKIAAGAVQAGQIAAGAVIAGKIAANAVTATEIAAGTITASEIAAGTITANEISAGTITGDKVAANTITASNLTVATLSAISADLGTVTAGSITGVDISTTGGEVQIDDTSGIRIESASGYVQNSAVSFFESATERLRIFYDITANRGAIEALQTGDVLDLVGAGGITITASGADTDITLDTGAGSSGYVFLDGNRWPNGPGVTGYFLRQAASSVTEWANLSDYTVTGVTETTNGGLQVYETGTNGTWTFELDLGNLNWVDPASDAYIVHVNTQTLGFLGRVPIEEMFNAITTLSTPAAGDYVLVNDVSLTPDATRRVLVEDLLSGVTNFTGGTGPVTSDRVLFKDSSETPDKVKAAFVDDLFQNLGSASVVTADVLLFNDATDGKTKTVGVEEVFDNLSIVALNTAATDHFIVHDATDGKLKKMKADLILINSGGYTASTQTQSDGYITMTLNGSTYEVLANSL